MRESEGEGEGKGERDRENYKMRVIWGQTCFGVIAN